MNHVLLISADSNSIHFPSPILNADELKPTLNVLLGLRMSVYNVAMATTFHGKCTYDLLLTSAYVQFGCCLN